MEVDVTGSQAVQSLIDQSGFSKFTIQRPGAHRNSSPVFEYLKGTKSRDAVDAFKSWSHNVLSGGSNANVYEIVLFNDLEDDPEDYSDLESGKRSKKKSRTLRFTFALTHYGSLPTINGPTQTTSVEDAVRLALAERDKQDLTKKVEALEQRLNELEEDEEDEEDEGNEMGGLGALERLAEILGTRSARVAAPAINGTDEPQTKVQFTKEQAQNINRALTVLYKYDQDIDTDLLKLAGIAQSNPTQFNFLLNALRNM